MISVKRIAFNGVTYYIFISIFKKNLIIKQTFPKYDDKRMTLEDFQNLNLR